MTQPILITGGTGFIGSHTVVALAEAGQPVVILDNLCNSSPKVLDRLARLNASPIEFVQADIRDSAGLDVLFARYNFAGVIHFAGLKAVGESVAQPLRYLENNVSGTINLLQAMDRANVRRIVFSSSATVYGDPARVPIREDFPTGPTNPYGRTKWMMEFVLSDLAQADPAWRVALLRYFNPVGAHPSGRISEDPNGLPNNLMPFVSQVAVGRLPRLRVFGGDYATPDGTGVRDYIHVVDLAKGHVAAVRRLAEQTGVLTVNLGTGRGYSVLDVVRAFEAASGRPVPFEIVERRAGDVAQCYAETALAEQLLGWRAERGIDEMCVDTWRWQSSNPQGYPD